MRNDAHSDNGATPILAARADAKNSLVALDRHVVDTTMCALGGNGVEIDQPLQPFTIDGDRELCAIDDAAHELVHVDFATQYTLVAATNTLTRLLAIDDQYDKRKACVVDDAVLDVIVATRALVTDDVNKSAMQRTRIEFYALDVVTVDEPHRSSAPTATALVARRGQFKKAKPCDRKTHAHRLEHDWLEQEVLSVIIKQRCTGAKPARRLSGRPTQQQQQQQQTQQQQQGQWNGGGMNNNPFDFIENNERTRKFLFACHVLTL